MEVEVVITSTTDPSGRVLDPEMTMTEGSGVTNVVIREVVEGGGGSLVGASTDTVVEHVANSVAVGDACVMSKMISMGTCTVVGPPAAK